MALQGSGQISLANIQTEFGGSNPISLNEYYRNGLYVTSNNTGVPTSGVISLSQFYSTTAQFSFTISSNYSTPQDLRTLALAAGWDGTDYLVVTNSAIISSNTTASAALTISGSFPNGVLLINNGTIVGMGGNGGYAESNGGTREGYAGGSAILVSSNTSINNAGTIAGGGGGGSSSASFGWSGTILTGGGGGGASGLTAAGAGFCYYNSTAQPSQYDAATGLYSIGGATSPGYISGVVAPQAGYGGSWGSAGGAGGYGGGAGGAAVSGNSYVTWVATGTRYGALV